MSARHDKARELRHKLSGGGRLNARLSKEADDALDMLCLKLRLQRRQVVERLILNACPEMGDDNERALMHRYGFSLSEARDYLRMELHA